MSVKCESFSILRDSESSVEIKYYIPKFLYAPVSRDTVVGKAVISYDNKETEILFYTCKDTEIDESVPLSLMEQLKWSWYYYNRYSNYIPMI